MKREIFLDADNLQDLNLLFRCVCCGALDTSDHLKSVNCANGDIIGRIFLRGRVSMSVLATVGHFYVCVLCYATST